MRDALDRWSWPARRWLCDRLVGSHAYSRNVAPAPPQSRFVDSYGQEWLVPRLPSDVPPRGPKTARWFESLDSSQRHAVNGAQFRPIFDQEAS